MRYTKKVFIICAIVAVSATSAQQFPTSRNLRAAADTTTTETARDAVAYDDSWEDLECDDSQESDYINPTNSEYEDVSPEITPKSEKDSDYLTKPSGTEPSASTDPYGALEPISPTISETNYQSPINPLSGNENAYGPNPQGYGSGFNPASENAYDPVGSSQPYGPAQPYEPVSPGLNGNGAFSPAGNGAPTPVNPAANRVPGQHGHFKC